MSHSDGVHRSEHLPAPIPVSSLSVALYLMDFLYMLTYPQFRWLLIPKVLGIMFPVRPLFGTSNAIAIFAALRSRFHDFSFNIQAKAMDLIEALLLVDPTPWLVAGKQTNKQTNN